MATPKRGTPVSDKKRQNLEVGIDNMEAILQEDDKAISQNNLFPF